MKVIRRQDAPSRHLGQEQRWSYQGEQVRVVITRIPPGHVQNEHRHDKMYDATYVLEGEVEMSERLDGELRWETVRKDDFVVFAPGPSHNIANRSDVDAVMLTLKFVRDPNIDAAFFQTLCETDWYPL